MAKEKDNYDVKKIYKMADIDHIRHNLGMYLGNTETSVKVLDEILDNSLDEVLAGFANIIAVVIDTKQKTISVLDNGRGIPNNPNLPEEEDPPVFTLTNLNTSGKFDKDKSGSAYKIAAGLHGVGMTAINAVADWIEMEIYRDGKHAKYYFEDSKLKSRSQETYKGEKSPFGTKVTVKPSERYFDSVLVPTEHIEERLRIACAIIKNLSTALIVDGKKVVIKGTEDELILDYISTTVPKWYKFNSKNKNKESCYIRLGWDTETPTTAKIMGCVNLNKTSEGAHINKLNNMIKTVFQQYMKKEYNFEASDCLCKLRAYIDLRIIHTSFDAQVKTKLTNRADISIMDDIERQIKYYFDTHKEDREELLNIFQQYRDSIKSKKVVRVSSKNRLSTGFTKLKDCSGVNGELFICEGDSAAGGLLEYRNPKKHAILPLKGNIPNATKFKDILENVEIKDILHALGCDIGDKCKIEDLRYNKILIAADSDPAGNQIAALCIILFASLFPAIIQHHKLFVCKTPLYGVYRKKQFVPIWSEDDVIIAKGNGETVKRFKGLGEFQSEDLKVFTLDEDTRNIIPVTWSEDYKKIFALFEDVKQKQKLVNGVWSL